jgi:hypoxanthine phosphoribosyltransferase
MADSLPPQSRILLSEAKIQARVRELGEQITDHYRGRQPLLLGVMNGALFFLADLLRAIDLPTEMTTIRLASYSGTLSTGRILGLDALEQPLAGKPVLIVDDILDTGLTLAELAGRLRDLGAEDVRICVLLSKRRPRSRPVHADWIGFDIPDVFVVGYGLDHDGRHRGLRDIRELPSPAQA